MTPLAGGKVSYERMLQAVGRLAENQRLRDICILEVEGGVVLQGQALVSTREGYHVASRTKVLSHDDLDKLMSGL